VVSLLPSATEIVCAIGAGELLVGRSHECDHPAGVRELPSVTRSRIGNHRSSRGIHEEVQSAVRDALSIYEVDTKLLAELAPDVILTQDLCEVCAVSRKEVESAVSRLARRPIRVVNLRPRRLGDIWQDVLRVGEALGRAEDARALAAMLEDRAAEISVRAAVPTRPRVLALEWMDPTMLAGLWMPELIDLAGGRGMGPGAGEDAVTVDRVALAALVPDVVLIKPCGFTIERSEREIALLPRVLPWSKWACVPAGRVFIADGNAYFNRPGPRIAESLEILAAIVHPKRFADLSARHAAAFRRVTRELDLVEA